MQVEELRQQVQVLQAVGYNSLEGFAGEEEGTAGAMTQALRGTLSQFMVPQLCCACMTASYPESRHLMRASMLDNKSRPVQQNVAHCLGPLLHTATQQAPVEQSPCACSWCRRGLKQHGGTALEEKSAPGASVDHGQAAGGRGWR